MGRKRSWRPNEAKSCETCILARNRRSRVGFIEIWQATYPIFAGVLRHKVIFFQCLTRIHPQRFAGARNDSQRQ